MPDIDISDVTVNDFKQGFSKAGHGYRCLYCSFSTERGIVYPVGEKLMDARRAMKAHVDQAHGGSFAALSGLDKKITGISDVQRLVLEGMAMGQNDASIAGSLGDKALSTVRNHRFNLRERYREAKILVSLMEMLNSTESGETLIDFPTTLRADDLRRIITRDEEKKILRKYIRDEQLLRFPKKEKEKLVILKAVAEKMESGKKYREAEVNTIISSLTDEYVTLRRYLVEYGFVDRTKDCSYYWLTDTAAE